MNTDKFDTTRHDKVIPITTFPKYYSWPTIAGLRNLYFKQNSQLEKYKDPIIEKMLFKKAGRVLINLSVYAEWISSADK